MTACVPLVLDELRLAEHLVVAEHGCRSLVLRIAPRAHLVVVEGAGHRAHVVRVALVAPGC